MGDNIRIYTATNSQKAHVSVMLSNVEYAETAKFEALIKDTLSILSSRDVKITVTNKSALTPYYEVKLKGFGNTVDGDEMNRMLEQSIMRDAAKKGYSLQVIGEGSGLGRLHRELVLTN